ncbi:MAG: 50S ribosomal protein L32 [Christensenellaceae bacterium]
MAVPKNRTSKQRRNSRRAHWKLTAPTMSQCPQCHQPKLSHRICPNCGYYNGRVAVAEQTAKTK